MRRPIVRERGSPIYIRGDSEVVTLVPELGVRDARMHNMAGLRLRVLSPSAVYVIDGGGVRRVAFGRVRARRGVKIAPMAHRSVSHAAPQPANIASVFGAAYQAGNKVLIPVAQVAIAATPTGEKRAAMQVAVIEVSGGKVQIRPIRNVQALAFVVMLAGAWYLYWILKTVAEWRARR